jgi:hypothetical protein
MFLKNLVDELRRINDECQSLTIKRNNVSNDIEIELQKNDNVAREMILPIKTSMDDCCVNFKNGSEIRAIVLGVQQSGDSARSFRFNMILIDEARLVKDDAVEEILAPMTKTKRQNILDLNRKYPNQPIIEKGKIVFISSAYLKTCDFYKRFIQHYHSMKAGSLDYFVCSLDYKVGVGCGLFYEDDILRERDKPSMSIDKWNYE